MCNQDQWSGCGHDESRSIFRAGLWVTNLWLSQRNNIQRFLRRFKNCRKGPRKEFERARDSWLKGNPGIVRAGGPEWNVED